MHHFEIVTLCGCSNTSNQREINTRSDLVHTGLLFGDLQGINAASQYLEKGG